MTLSSVKPWQRVGAEVRLEGRAAHVVDAHGTAVLLGFHDDGTTSVARVADVDLVDLHPVAQCDSRLRRCIRRDAHAQLDPVGRCTRCGLRPGTEPRGLLGVPL